jgi:hypothetical protein
MTETKKVEYSMLKQAAVIAAGLSLLLSGCTIQAEGAASSSEGLDSVSDISEVTASKLRYGLTGSDGTAYTVYFHAPKETVSKEKAPSCMAQEGDTVRTGDYALYLQKGEGQPQRQNLQLFDGELLSFNDSREGMVRVLPQAEGWSSDLLAVNQYLSCNGSLTSVIGLSPDGSKLQTYTFELNGEKNSTRMTASLEQMKSGGLLSSSYVNGTGGHYTNIWQVDGQAGLLFSKRYMEDLTSPGASPEEAAKLLFTRYLEGLKGKETSGETRLRDYRLEEMKLEQPPTEESEGVFVFRVFYSVLPDSMDYVLAGNGEAQADGWITGRSLYGQALISNDSMFSLTNLSTGL